MTQFIALIHKDESSDFGVSFPDLPGCVTAGTTLVEARLFAEEALALHLAGLVEDNAIVPVPSTWDAITSMSGSRDAVAMVVPVHDSAHRLVSVSVAMPEDVLELIDARASLRGLDRSRFLVEAAQHELERDAEPA